VIPSYTDEATKWARLLAVAQDCRDGWHVEDLTLLWQHHREATLESQVAEAPLTGQADACKQLGADGQRTLSQLLALSSPPRETLLALKDWAKELRASADFPPEIATALYYSLIAAMLARYGECRTSLDDDTVRRGLQWAADVPWMDPSTRSLIETALRSMPPT
jgi:hypothetical protein